MHRSTPGAVPPHFSFWRLSRADWRAIGLRTWSEMGEDNISLLAAGVAFYSFLASVPLLASIVLVYGIAVAPAEVAVHIRELTRILPSDAAAIVGDQLKSLTEAPVTRSTIGLIVAILLALYGAMRGATSVIGALNIAYGEREQRNFFKTTGLSFVFTAGAVVAAIVAMLAISAMSLVGTWIAVPPVVAPAIKVGLWLVTAGVAAGLIALVYRYGPDRANGAWLGLVPGAAFASVGALLATFLFGLYVSHFAGYNATYGALGAVVSFLMWLYVTAFVLLLGAELNSEIERRVCLNAGQVPAETIAAAQPVPSRDAVVAHPVRRDPSWSAPVAAGMMAARVSRVGGVRVGTVPMTLLSTGIALVGRKDKARIGLMCLGAGAALAFKAHRDTRRAERAARDAPGCSAP